MLVIDKVLVLLVGGLFGIAISLSGMFSLKWAVFFIAVLGALMVFLVMPHKEKILLFGFLFSISISLSYHPLRLPYIDMFYRPVTGFAITLTDIFFFGLFLFWLKRLLVEGIRPFYFTAKISLPFLVMLLLVIIGIFHANEPNFIRFTKVFLSIKCFVIFLYFSNNIKDLSSLYVLFAAIVIALLIQSFFGYLQYLSGSDLGLSFLGEVNSTHELTFSGGTIKRAVGLLGSPNRLGGLIDLFLPIIVAIFFATIHKPIKYLLLLPIAFLVLGLDIITFSRGSWIGIGIAVTLTIYFSIVKLMNRKILPLYITVIAIVIGVTVLLAAVEPVRDRVFDSADGTDSAASVRVPLMVNAYTMIKHNYVTGVGLGNYSPLSSQYDMTNWVSYVFPWPVHNVYLLLAAELGLPGLLMFLLIILATLFQLYRVAISDRNNVLSFAAIGMIGGLIAWCIHHLVDFNYPVISVMFWTYIGTAHALVTINDSMPEPEEEAAADLIFERNSSPRAKSLG